MQKFKAFKLNLLKQYDWLDDRFCSNDNYILYRTLSTRVIKGSYGHVKNKFCHKKVLY